MAVKDNFQEELLNTIETFVDKALSKKTFSHVVASVVIGIVNNKYKVSIDGHDYLIKDAVGINPNIGTGVWVMIPDAGIGRAFIVGKI